MQTREWYRRNEDEVVKSYDDFEVEQSGFLFQRILTLNVWRRILWKCFTSGCSSLFTVKERINGGFHCSGFNGVVHSIANKYDDEYNAESIFNGMNIILKEVKFKDGNRRIFS